MKNLEKRLEQLKKQNHKLQKKNKKLTKKLAKEQIIAANYRQQYKTGEIKYVKLTAAVRNLLSGIGTALDDIKEVSGN